MARAMRYELKGREAERLLREWGITTLPVDVHAIAGRQGILVKAMPADVAGVSGMLVRDGENFAIGYATWIDNPGFQRFSIAHELGHYFLAGHPEALLAETGSHHSRAGFGSGDEYELEADHFAARLLMPSPSFEREMERVGSGFRAIRRLAQKCETSLESTAIRFAEASEEPVAVVVSTGQVVDYWFASESFKRTPGIDWIKKKTPLPAATPTAAFNKDPQRVESGARWEESSNVRDWFSDGPGHELAEDVVGLGRYGKTLTVLFAEAWPDEEEEEDENLGAFEPTFHRSRRR